MDGVSTAVRWVTAAFEQSRVLQVVDQRHEPARIEAHALP
jgi:hypothetical protein